MVVFKCGLAPVVHCAESFFDAWIAYRRTARQILFSKKQQSRRPRIFVRELEQFVRRNFAIVRKRNEHLPESLRSKTGSVACVPTLFFSHFQKDLNEHEPMMLL